MIADGTMGDASARLRTGWWESFESYRGARTAKLTVLYIQVR